jgi:large subunit ribosomal protein L25
MAEKIVLEATKRQLTGKQVEQLRRKGIIPAVLYGPEIPPMPIQVKWLDLRPTLTQASGSKILDLNVDGETYTVLVREVKRRPIRNDVMHVDFIRVRMNVIMRTEVPVTLVGDIAALEKKGVILIHETTSVHVECMPIDLPSVIHVDISGIKEAGDLILASQLPQIPGVTYHVDPDTSIVTTTAVRDEVEDEEGAGSAEPELIRKQREEDEE